MPAATAVSYEAQTDDARNATETEDRDARALRRI